jgi:hypothetical protein
LKARRSDEARKSDNSLWLARVAILGLVGWADTLKSRPVSVEALTYRGAGFNVTGFFENFAAKYGGGP